MRAKAPKRSAFPFEPKLYVAVKYVVNRTLGDKFAEYPRLVKSGKHKLGFRGSLISQSTKLITIYGIGR